MRAVFSIPQDKTELFFYAVDIVNHDAGKEVYESIEADPVTEDGQEKTVFTIIYSEKKYMQEIQREYEKLKQLSQEQI